jgi:putative endonuclease
MELLTGYGSKTADTTSGWGMHGVRAAAAMERARCGRRPAQRVFFDERQRAGGAGGSGGPAGGGTYQSGLFGEEVVADGLVADGWRMLGHRVRTRVGEIDIVARRHDTVVFAEVKTAGPGRLGVEECVSAKQRLRIRRAAVAWMAANPRLQRGVRRYRFDVFLVRRDEDGAIVRIDHVRDAF